MSVRTIDTRFNLRTVVEAETASIPLVLTQAPASGLFSNTSTPPKPKGPGIKFDFGQLKSTPYAATPAPVPKVDLRPTQFAVPLKNAFEQPKDNSKADVMRLTAVVDDLTTRLKKAQERAAMAETHLQKTQTALVSERSNAADKIKGLTAQLAAAHTTEGNLRSELSKAAKATVAATQPKPASFESAVGAVMAADGAAEKAKKEIDGLKADVKDRDLSIKALNAQIAELRTESVSLNEASSQVHRKFSDAVRELAEAREAERRAVAELEDKTLELKEATKRAEDAEASAASEKGGQAADEQPVVEQPVVEQPVVESSVVEQLVSPMPAHEPLPETFDMRCCAKCASPLPDDQDTASEATVGAIAAERELSAEAPEAAPPVSVVALDPIAMHAKYTQMRERVLKLTASIAKMQRSGQEEELLPAMVTKRDEIYKRAKELKAQYDSIFGAVDPDSVVKLSGLEKYNATSESNLSAEAEEYEFAPVGDAPRPPCTYVISFAKEMAANNAVAGAFDFGSYDSGHHVGKSMFKPITANGVEIGDEAKENVEPTEGHDAQSDMVKAVISDMTRFLKHVSSAQAEQIESHDQAVLANGV